MRVPHLYYHEIAESDFSPTLVADGGDDEDEDEEEEEEEHRRDEEEEEEEPIWTASPSGRESVYRVEMDSMTRATILKVDDYAPGLTRGPESLLAARSGSDLIVDLQGPVVDLNDEVVRSYSWTREDLLGQPVTMMTPQADGKLLEERLERCRKGENDSSNAVASTRAAGNIRYCSPSPCSPMNAVRPRRSL